MSAQPREAWEAGDHSVFYGDPDLDPGLTAA